MKWIIVLLTFLPFIANCQIPKATKVVEDIHVENTRLVEGIKRGQVQDNFSAALADSKEYLETALSATLQEFKLNKNIFPFDSLYTLVVYNLTDWNRSTFSGIIRLNGQYFTFRAGEEKMSIKKSTYEKLPYQWKKWITVQTTIQDSVVQHPGNIVYSHNLLGEFAISTHWANALPKAQIYAGLLYFPAAK